MSIIIIIILIKIKYNYKDIKNTNFFYKYEAFIHVEKDTTKIIKYKYNHNQATYYINNVQKVTRNQIKS